MTIQTPPDSDIPEREPDQQPPPDGPTPEQPREPGVDAPGGDPQDAPMRMPSDNPDVETDL